MQIDPAIVAVARAAGAMIFAGSAAMKFAAPIEFRAAVENYRIVPESIAGLAAWVVPVLELAGAVGLVFSVSRASAAFLLLGLLAIFTGAIMLNLARGRREIDCGCFGPMMRQRLSGWLVVRNIALAMMVATASANPELRTLLPLDYVTIVSGGLAVVILYIVMNYLLANAPMIAGLGMRDA
jgi:hypothetical protein